MKTRSSIKAVMSATGVALALTSGSAMADLSTKTVRKIANQEITKRAPGLIGATGPAGDVGAQGPAGATGPTSAEGAQGPAGLTGATGSAGAEGAPGPAGPTGAKGLAGAKGLTGATGPAGDTGPAGPAGDIGPAGPAAVQRYVHVLSDGTVDASRSLGVTQANVGVAAGNLYCLVGLPLVKGGQVSVDYNEVPLNETAQFGFSNDPGCESFVVVFDNAGNRVSGGFFLTLY